MSIDRVRCSVLIIMLPLYLLFSCAFVRTVQAQASYDYDELDIEHLMQIEITTASKHAQSFSEVPAALFVLTGEDIRRSGVTSIAAAIYGVELTVDFQPNRTTRVVGSYTWNEIDNRNTSSIPVGSFIEAADSGMPDHQANLRFYYRILEEVEAQLTLRYVDRLNLQVAAGTGQLTVPKYLEADVRIGWTLFEDLELSLVGRNLLERAHPEFYSQFAPSDHVEVERGYYGYLTYKY